MDTQYDEQLIKESGLNVKLCKNLYLCDILRIEYLQDLSPSLSITYLNHLSLHSKYTIYQNTPFPIPDFSVILLPDWSIILKSKPCYKTILITPVSSFTFPVSNCIQVFLNSSTLTSYKATGLISLFFSVKNPILFLELYKKLDFTALSLKAMAEIKSFLFVSSKIPYKTLHLNIQEAKETLKSRFCYKTEIKPQIRPHVSLEIIYKLKTKKIDMDLYEIGENSESLEYSPTLEINSTRNSRKSSDMKKNVKLTLPDIAEEPTHKKSLSEIAGIMNTAKFHKTPLNSPRQLSYSITEVKQMLHLVKNLERAPELNRNTCSCSHCNIY